MRNILLSSIILKSSKSDVDEIAEISEKCMKILCVVSRGGRKKEKRRRDPVIRPAIAEITKTIASSVAVECCECDGSEDLSFECR